MNFVVIGLGSMGKRRVRLLKEYIEKNNKKDFGIFGIDLSAERREDAEKEFNIKTAPSLSEILKDVKLDAAVISTSPLSHAAIIKECLEKNLHVFTEINLVSDGYEENISLAKKKGKKLFLSSTPMYRNEMQYIKDEVQKNARPLTYHYHIGQYLPEWHPWESYKSFFVADKKTNAIRELFAIELPWLFDAFGEVNDFHSIHNKSTKLELDYDDSFEVILKHSDGTIGNISIDVATPKTIREFETYGENFYVEWMGTPDTLKKMEITPSKEEGKLPEKNLKNVSLYDDVEHKEGYNSFIIENAYYAELEEFIEAIEGKEKPRYSFEKDLRVLKLIDEIGA